MFAMTTNGYLTYSIPFLELYPEYICPPEKPDCNHKDWCASNGTLPINWESPRSLNNWVESLGLACKYHLGCVPLY